MGAVRAPFGDGSLTTTPPFVALVLYWGVFGALSSKTYTFYHSFPNEKLSIKPFVYKIYLASEVVQAAMVTHTLLCSFFHGYANTELFSIAGSSWPLFEGLVAFVVQALCAYRIRAISHNKIIPCVVFLMGVTSLAGAMAISVDHTDLIHSVQLTYKNGPSFDIWQGALWALDFFIAFCATYEIIKDSQQTNISEPNDNFSGVLCQTIKAATPTVALFSASFVLVCALVPAPYESTVLPCLSKLYSTTMVAVLSSRMLSVVHSTLPAWNERDEKEG